VEYQGESKDLDYAYQFGRSLPSSMSSCRICWIPSGKSEFCRIPWNFNGKQLAGASAILVSNSMEIPTFFQGIPMEMVGIPEPPGMIPMGITVIYIVKNSYNSKNRTLGSRTNHVHRKSSILTAAPYNHYKSCN